MDKPPLSLTSYKTEKMYPTSINSNQSYNYLVLDDDLGTRQSKYEYKTKPSLKLNDLFLSNDYNSNYKPYSNDFYTTISDYHNNPYDVSTNSKNYGKTMSFRSPKEYQVYYFPTSKPIPQYSRQTTDGFYRRKPVKQYPQEEVPQWRTRYPTPIKVIEREPLYPMNDYSYRNPNDYYHIGNTQVNPYIPEYQSRYFPMNNDVYHSYDNNSYNHDTDLEQRSFSSATRPCSPVYSSSSFYDKTYLENTSSLLERKIRDYVWNPHEERIEKYIVPNYKKSTYSSDFKPLQNKYHRDKIFKNRSSLELNPQVQRIPNKNVYKKNVILTSPERKPSIDQSFQPQKNDERFLEYLSHKKKSETPIHFPKRISFDFDGEDNVEPSSHTNSLGYNTEENMDPKYHAPILERKESSAKLEDMHRTSLTSNDDFSNSKSQTGILPSKSKTNPRKTSLVKQEKVVSNENFFDTDIMSSSLKNDSQNDNPPEKNNNENEMNNEYTNDVQNYSKSKAKKTRDVSNDELNGTTYYDQRRDSNVNSRRKLSGANEKVNVPHVDRKNILKKRDDATNRRESYKNEQKLKKENFSSSRKNSVDVDNQSNLQGNSYKNQENEPHNKIIKSPIKNRSIDHDNSGVTKYNINQQKHENLQQFIDNNSHVENESYVNDKTDFTDSTLKDKSDLEGISNKNNPLQKNVENQYLDDENYYKDYSNDGEKEQVSNEYEAPPEHDINDKNYYLDKIAESNKDTITNSRVEPAEHPEFVDENRVHGSYYYQNPAEEVKENPTENQYENIKPQENSSVKHVNDDDYYYQNYSNDDTKEQQEVQYADQPDHQREYLAEHPANNNDYYYQDNAREEGLMEPQGDQHYIGPSYQGNYEEPHQNVDDGYYYQNYPGTESKEQPENQYAEPSHQGEYTAEHHDNYYYESHPKNDTNENLGNQNYAETEHPGNVGNYVDEQQANYYYEDKSNVNPDEQLTSHFDERAQQENYANDQQTNDGYYYQKPDDNYDESTSKAQYDGYVGDQHEADNSHYPDFQPNNYDPQHNYDENNYPTQQPEYVEQYEQNPNYDENNYPTQQSEYVEQYEQNPNNEEYGYADNVVESQSTDQVNTEVSK